jgi:hypothetical protein
MKTWLALLLLASCTSTRPVTKSVPPWIAESNKVATEYTRAYGELVPEQASDLGFDEFSARVTCFQVDSDSKMLGFLAQWNTRLNALESGAVNSEVKTDLRILRSALADYAQGIRLDQKYRSVDFTPVARVAFERLRKQINEQSNPQQRAAGGARFQQYVFPPKGCLALADYGVQRIRYQEQRAGKLSKLYPARSEIELYLEEVPTYLEEIKSLLAQSGHRGWEPTFAKFSQQVKAHDDFVRAEILPKAKTDFALPPEIYQHILRGVGVDDAPRAIAQRARRDFKKVYAEFARLAKVVAAERGFADSTPPAVIRELKKMQITDPAELRTAYLKNDQRLQELIVRHDLVTLPRAPLQIRIAGDAESKVIPSPHLLAPVLVGNTGQRPEFVIPSAPGGKMLYDDFSYREAMIGLGAHEGRPGHDLQFSAMLDRGVSLIRAYYAFNSVNAEGWGLYAEEMMYPYMSDAEKFALLQLRLMRIARMFMDPELHLKISKPKVVSETLSGQLGFSPGWTASELRRYTTENPGQATSYYFGLEKMRRARANAQTALGPNFREKCFHDFVLDQGLLPLNEVVERAKTISCAEPKL